MKDTREIYSIQDCKKIVEEVLEEELSLGMNVIECLVDEIEKQFKYVNWIRFQDANCPGCVSGPKECDIAFGRGEYSGTWKKINAGEIQDCPARGGGGTFVQDEKGFRKIDIASHNFSVVEPLKEK